MVMFVYATCYYLIGKGWVSKWHVIWVLGLNTPVQSTRSIIIISPLSISEHYLLRLTEGGPRPGDGKGESK